ncbi:MAG: hypothetical protein HYV35_10310 [Lentisphaerae bacterium]|nr:hypothetical protein [Lentisphaerota bacterium]
MKQTTKTPGPFYDFSDAQWRSVRDVHARFGDRKGLGRPVLLFDTREPLSFPDVSEDEFNKQEIVFAGTGNRNADWDAGIRMGLRNAYLLGRTRYAYDSYPMLFINRDFYGHSQRLAEPFGTTTVVEGDGNAQAYPSIHSLADVWHLKPKPVKECHYLSQSLAVLRYFDESTEGRYHIPHYVTTGPTDTVNYATGSTLMLLGFYENPKAVHHLLRIATDIIIEHILDSKKIVGDRLVSDHTWLLDGCYAICSEIRSQFSAEHYEEFEAPYLKEIGAAIGPLHIHTSGSINQSLPATLKDKNIKHLKFWLKDSDLKQVVDLIGDRLSIDMFRNDDVPSCSFGRRADFYRYIFATIKPETRWVVPTVPFCEPREFNQAYDEMEAEGTLPEQVRNFGRLYECNYYL